MSNYETTIKASRDAGSKRTLLMNKITAYVHNHIGTRITLKQIAAYCGVSVSTVTQLFQKKIGITFHQYVTRCRMEVARQLIYTDMPLEEVGRQVGYTDHSTFYRAFKQTFGMSPREYRKDLERKWAEEDKLSAECCNS